LFGNDLRRSNNVLEIEIAGALICIQIAETVSASRVAFKAFLSESCTSLKPNAISQPFSERILEITCSDESFTFDIVQLQAMLMFPF